MIPRDYRATVNETVKWLRCFSIYELQIRKTEVLEILQACQIFHDDLRYRILMFCSDNFNDNLEPESHSLEKWSSR